MNTEELKEYFNQRFEKIEKRLDRLELHRFMEKSNFGKREKPQKEV